MKLYERFKNYIKNDEYYISFYNNSIYIMHYKKVNNFTDNKIEISFKDKKLLLKGSNFCIKRKNDVEIEIGGYITNMEFVYE